MHRSTLDYMLAAQRLFVATMLFLASALNLLFGVIETVATRHDLSAIILRLFVGM